MFPRLPTMSSSICALCLGDDTEIPSFGTTKDAEDLIMPCSTCSLVVHKMCLMEWFNSLPTSKVTRTFRDEIPRRSSLADSRSDVGVFPPVDDDLDDPGMFNFNSRWGRLLVTWGTESYVYTPSQDMVGLGDNSSVMLAADCPQCKNKIVFKMSHSSLLALNTLVRSSIKDMVLYLGVFMGVSGAAIGIVTVGYAGLTRCGVNMLEVMVPESILISLLRRKPQSGPATTLSAAVPLADRMDWDVNVLSHFRFQLVPLLPLVLFRMRFSSIFGCIFNSSALSLLTDAFNEFLVCQYVSSLGNHTLAKGLYANLRHCLASVWKSRSMGALGWAGLTKNISWWDPNVMIGSMIPARWIYDLLFRLTINKRHFDLSMAVRPRSIANSLSESELAKYELIESKLGRLHFELRDKVRKAKRNSPVATSPSPMINAIRHKLLELLIILKEDFAWRWLKLKLQAWLFKLIACLKNDYSTSLLTKLRVVTGVTTFLWPFLAADVGRIMLAVLQRSSWFLHVPRPKLILFANLVGMFGVTIIKDLFNLYLSAHKANTLSNMTIVTSRGSQSSASTTPAPVEQAAVPGAFNQ